MKSIALSAAVVCTLSTFALGQPQQQSPQDSQPQQRIRDDARANMEEGAQNKREHCVRENMAGNQFEIQLSQAVEQKAQNPSVKQLAHRIADDHQKAQQELQQIAKDSPSLNNAQLMPHQQAILEEMQKKPVEEMERGYVFHMVGDHETDLLAYRWQADHAPDANLQKYARDQIPALEEHLRLARAAAEQYVGEARQAGERMRGTNSLNNAASAGHDSHNYSNQPNNQGAGAPGGSGPDRTVGR